MHHIFRLLGTPRQIAAAVLALTATTVLGQSQQLGFDEDFKLELA
jgi:hypothetical protein